MIKSYWEGMAGKAASVKSGSESRGRPAPTLYPVPTLQAQVPTSSAWPSQNQSHPHLRQPQEAEVLQFYCGDTATNHQGGFPLVSKGNGHVLNFLQGGLFIGRSDNKQIYRLYATLYLSSVWIPQQAYLAF